MCAELSQSSVYCYSLIECNFCVSLLNTAHALFVFVHHITFKDIYDDFCLQLSICNSMLKILYYTSLVTYIYQKSHAAAETNKPTQATYHLFI